VTTTIQMSPQSSAPSGESSDQGQQSQTSADEEATGKEATGSPQPRETTGAPVDGAEAAEKWSQCMVNAATAGGIAGAVVGKHPGPALIGVLGGLAAGEMLFCGPRSASPAPDSTTQPPGSEESQKDP
jgi:hypothetical protein